MRAFFGLLLHQRRRNAGLQLQSAAKRYFADRGATRLDFSDPGFQELGYISANWYENTVVHRLDVNPKDYTHTPLFAGVYEDNKAYKMRLKKMGDARKAYEDAKVKEDMEKRMRDSAVAEDAKQRASKKVDYPSKRLKRRDVKDFSNFGYEGSGLDEYTQELQKKKIKMEEKREARKRSGLRQETTAAEIQEQNQHNRKG